MNRILPFFLFILSSVVCVALSDKSPILFSSIIIAGVLTISYLLMFLNLSEIDVSTNRLVGVSYKTKVKRMRYELNEKTPLVVVLAFHVFTPSVFSVMSPNPFLMFSVILLVYIIGVSIVSLIVVFFSKDTRIKVIDGEVVGHYCGNEVNIETEKIGSIDIDESKISIYRSDKNLSVSMYVEDPHSLQSEIVAKEL